MKGKKSEDHLLGVLRAAVVVNVADGGEESCGGAGGVAGVEGVEVGGERAAAGEAGHAEAGGVHVLARREVVAGADSVPDAELGGVPAEEGCAHADAVVLLGGAPLVAAVAQLVALALLDGVVHESRDA